MGLSGVPAADIEQKQGVSVFTDRSWPGGTNRAMSPDDVAPSTPARRPTDRTDPAIASGGFIPRRRYADVAPPKDV